jgi:hypothetical protein
MSDRAIKFAPVRKTIRVKASQAHAFKVFGSFAWWPKSHTLMGGKPTTAVIEPRVGGRWYERAEDGSDCNWGSVLAWDPPKRMLLKWQIGGKFGYDPTINTEVEVNFIAESPNATRVELEHRHFETAGETAEALRKAVDDPNGWTQVMAVYSAAVEAA